MSRTVEYRVQARSPEFSDSEWRKTGGKFKTFMAAKRNVEHEKEIDQHYPQLSRDYRILEVIEREVMYSPRTITKAEERK